MQGTSTLCMKRHRLPLRNVIHYKKSHAALFCQCVSERKLCTLLAWCTIGPNRLLARGPRLGMGLPGVRVGWGVGVGVGGGIAIR